MLGGSSASRARLSTGPRLALLGAALATLGACGGGGGGSTPAPPPPAPVNGNCGAELNQCLAGTLLDTADGDDDYLWNCTGLNGGTTASCSLAKPAVDGECGAELNQCDAGTLFDADDSDADFLWECDGLRGGTTASCSLPKPVDGECSEVHNQCLAGTPNDVEDTDDEYLWDCDGLHGGQGTACSIGKPVFCANGAAADSNPLLCERGRYTIDGIDRLPLDQVQLTNEEMQALFVTNDIQEIHAKEVGQVACESYVTRDDRCEDQTNRTGTTRYAEDDTVSKTGLAPFTELVDASRIDDISWLVQEMESIETAKIAIYTTAFFGEAVDDGAVPYLVIFSAGNGESHRPWFDEMLTEKQKLITETIAANKLLFVGGWDQDADDNYVQHPESNNCWGVDDGCLWTRFVFKDDPWIGDGTSYSAPQIGASLASVLSIFPDTAHQDLAKLARACAKKTGEGIDGDDGLLAVSGGFGVADFACMDGITDAAADLPSDGTATVTVDGHEVTVTRRRLTVEPPPD